MNGKGRWNTISKDFSIIWDSFKLTHLLYWYIDILILIDNIFLSWSDCSRSCGGGIQHSRRNCSNPVPEGGGLYCIGSRVRYESCNTRECPKGSQDPRLQQCQTFNGNNFNIVGIPTDVKWVPKYTGSMSVYLFE